MKNFLFLVAFMSSLSISAQNTMVHYNFQYGTVTDLSGNGNDGTLTGRSGINCSSLNGVLVGNGLSNYLTVPSSVLNELKDFTVELHVAFSYWCTAGASSQNTIMSTSNLSATNFFGIAYDRNNLEWKLSFNGQVHRYADADVVMEGNWIVVTRESGVINFYHDSQLLGSFIDKTTVNVSSIIIGQQEHCEGGCFECNQTMHGSLDYFKVLDFAARKSDIAGNSVSHLNLYPNPVNDVLHIYSSGKKYSTVIITDYSGKIMSVNSYKEEINVADLAAGMYFLQLKSSDNMVSDRVGFVKQ